MEKFNVIKDIAERTGGDIYLGIVGPVRTGKSTFIKKFMEELVIPEIDDKYAQERALDELPQSGGGKTVMTTEPKFIPSEAVEINVCDGVSAKLRMIDCVGYCIDGALGFEEDESPRMVHTPWFEEAIPFTEAAEIGTKKVICEHSTIGIMISTDGTVTDIERSSYVEAEQRVVAEMKELGKPFLMILNSLNPHADSVISLAEELQTEYGITVLPMNIARMTINDMQSVLMELLYEFPVTEVNVDLPRWIEELDKEHWLRSAFENAVKNGVSEIKRVRDINILIDALQIEDIAESVELLNMELGTGSAHIAVTEKEELFYKILAEFAGEEIEGDFTIMRLMKDYSKAYKQWTKIENAMEDVWNSGYGVVSPRLDEMYLEEPQLIKQGGRFGVKLKASAPSYHIIKADISTEITPLIGTESQCEELVKFILSQFEEDPQQIWNTNIFGKSLQELVQDGINGKVYQMPENARHKLQMTLQRIVNDGGGGLICIIL